MKWLDDPTVDVVRLEGFPGVVGWEDEDGNIFVCSHFAREAADWIGQYLLDMLGGRYDLTPDVNALHWGLYKPGPNDSIVACEPGDEEAVPIYTLGNGEYAE